MTSANERLRIGTVRLGPLHRTGQPRASDPSRYTPLSAAAPAATADRRDSGLDIPDRRRRAPRRNRKGAGSGRDLLGEIAWSADHGAPAWGTREDDRLVCRTMVAFLRAGRGWGHRHCDTGSLAVDLLGREPRSRAGPRRRGSTRQGCGSQRSERSAGDEGANRGGLFVRNNHIKGGESDLSPGI